MLRLLHVSAFEYGLNKFSMLTCYDEFLYTSYAFDVCVWLTMRNIVLLSFLIVIFIYDSRLAHKTGAFSVCRYESNKLSILTCYDAFYYNVSYDSRHALLNDDKKNSAVLHSSSSFASTIVVRHTRLVLFLHANMN